MVALNFTFFFSGFVAGRGAVEPRLSVQKVGGFLIEGRFLDSVSSHSELLHSPYVASFWRFHFAVSGSVEQFNESVSRTAAIVPRRRVEPEESFDEEAPVEPEVESSSEDSDSSE